MPTIYVQATRAQVRDAIYLAVQIASGVRTAGAGHRDYSIAISILAGNALLANIKSNFETKSKGNIGYDGEKWTPLLPATVRKKVESNRKSLMGKTALAAARRERYKAYLAKVAAARAALGLATPTAPTGTPAAARKVFMRDRRKSIERRVAIAVGYFPHEVVPQPGYSTYPFALTLILRDKGILYQSFTAGYQAQRPTAAQAPQQTFEANPGEVIVGTKVPYAVHHQWGAPKAGVPRRQILPEPGQIPAAWWDDVVDAVAGGVSSLVQLLLRGAP